MFFNLIEKCILEMRRYQLCDVEPPLPLEVIFLGCGGVGGA